MNAHTISLAEPSPLITVALPPAPPPSERPRLPRIPPAARALAFSAVKSAAVVFVIASWFWLLGFWLQHRGPGPQLAEPPRVASEVTDGGIDGGPQRPSGPEGYRLVDHPSYAASHLLLASDVAPEE